MYFGCLSKSFKEGQAPQVSSYTDIASEDNDSLLFSSATVQRSSCWLPARLSKTDLSTINCTSKYESGDQSHLWSVERIRTDHHCAEPIIASRNVVKGPSLFDWKIYYLTLQTARHSYKKISSYDGTEEINGFCTAF